MQEVRYRRMFSWYSGNAFKSWFAEGWHRLWVSLSYVCFVGLRLDKTLFERIFLSVRKTQHDIELFCHKSVKLPIYVMTSEFNQKSIRSIIERHHYYGLDESQFILFSQGSLPCVDQNGHFVMREKHKVSILRVLNVDCSVSWWKWWLLFRITSSAYFGSMEGTGYRICACIWDWQCHGDCRTRVMYLSVACWSFFPWILLALPKRCLFKVCRKIVSGRTTLCCRKLWKSTLFSYWFRDGLSFDLQTKSWRGIGLS